jgi:predicted amidohydrolase YtcJ
MLTSTLPVRFALDFLGPQEFREGDVFVANDPYHGGGHLPDYNVFAPCYATDPSTGERRMVLIASIQCHHGDTGGGVPGLRAIAANGWRGEDHTLNLPAFSQQVTDREIVNAEIPLNGLRWILSHVPQTTDNLVNRWKAMGGGLLVGWGPTRTRAAGAPAIGPVYRTLFDNGIPLGYHSDGGDITVINPWLNFYTMITGRNLRGDLVNDNQVLTRQETMWLATAANKWFIWEDDVGSIEPGNHADFVVLDRDFFTIPDAQIPRVQSVLTVIGGKVKYDAGVVQVPKAD